MTLPAVETLIKNISISESGLRSNPIDFYVRQECADQWEFLEKAVTTNGVYCVEGASGVGKSVLTYWCVTAMAKRFTKDLIYIHDTEMGTWVVLYSVCENTFKFTKINALITIQDYEAFEDWICDSQFDILVLDGVPSKEFIMFALTFYDKTCRSIIYCTSFIALNISAESWYDISPETFFVTSWTREDYDKAIDAGLIIDNFEEKYFYFGSSISSMFWNKDAMLPYLDYKIRNIEFYDVKRLLWGHVRERLDARGKMDDRERSNDAVNSLICVFKNQKSIFRSEYVTRQLSRICNSETIANCKWTVTDNLSWQGWVAQLEVLSMVRNTNTLKIWTDQGGSEMWTGEILEYTVLRELENHPFTSNMFLLPTLWNEGAFHFLYKPLGRRLQAVIVTIGRSYAFKSEHILAAARYCDSTELDVTFLCRKKNFSKFIVPATSEGGILIRKVSFESLSRKRNHNF